MAIFISDALRTPIGTAGGAFASVEAAQLAAPVLERLAADLKVGQVILGNVRGPGGNVARVAALAAGLSDSPAFTVDRQCGSGLAAIEAGIHWSEATGQVVIAGGTQSASTQPLTLWQGDPPRRFERAPFAPAGFADPDMGEAADLLAHRAGVSRARQDAYALRSHQRAVAAQASGFYADEIVPIAGVERDERPHSGFTAERLARFRPIFRPQGTVTAANSCGINDGAAACVVTPTRPAGSCLRVAACVSATCDSAEPGWGIVPATRLALSQAGIGADEIDVIEFNEAFAGQVLACCDELGIDEERVCPEGGAIALGHPWGASGAVLVTRLFSQLARRGTGRWGLAALGIGGGQGTALVVERLPKSQAW